MNKHNRIPGFYMLFVEIVSSKPFLLEKQYVLTKLNN